MDAKCSVIFCQNIPRSSGICNTHRYQLKKYGKTFPIGELRKNLNVKSDPLPACAVSHCNREALSRVEGSLCNPHYQKQHRGYDPEKYYVKNSGRTERLCLVDECHQRVNTKGLCKRHYISVCMGRTACPEGTDVQVNPPCSFEGCDEIAKSRKVDSLCPQHTLQRRDGIPLFPLTPNMSQGGIECFITNCQKPAITKHMCSAHSARANTHKLPPVEMDRLMSLGACQNEGCGITANLHIDHDHSTGLVRDVLCSGCNTALGLLGESRDRIAGLLAYLDRHSQIVVT